MKLQYIHVCTIEYRTVITVQTQYGVYIHTVHTIEYRSIQGKTVRRYVHHATSTLKYNMVQIQYGIVRSSTVQYDKVQYTWQNSTYTYRVQSDSSTQQCNYST